MNEYIGGEDHVYLVPFKNKMYGCGGGTVGENIETQSTALDTMRKLSRAFHTIETQDQLKRLGCEIIYEQLNIEYDENSIWLYFGPEGIIEIEPLDEYEINIRAHTYGPPRSYSPPVPFTPEEEKEAKKLLEKSKLIPLITQLEPEKGIAFQLAIQGYGNLRQIHRKEAQYRRWQDGGLL